MRLNRHCFRLAKGILWGWAMLALFGTPSLLIAQDFEDAEPAKNDLFNGRDLNGFQYLEEHWKVVDGAIVGSSHPSGIKFNTFLCTNREFANFDLQFKVRLVKDAGNSGLQIRSKLVDTNRFTVHGPQVDLAPGYWGSLFGEHFGPNRKHVMMKQADAEAVKKVIKSNDFNQVRIICVGKHLKVTVNGMVTVDQKFADMPDKGVIAFQLHQGPAMEVIFKDIVFKELQ